MKIIDWFKKFIIKSKKKDYMLDEGNNQNKTKQEEKKDFIPRVDVRAYNIKKQEKKF